MKRFFRCILISLFLIPGLFGPFPDRSRAESGTRFRLALVCSGPYKDYQLILRGFFLGLRERGLIENGEAPLGEGESLEGIWEWAGENAGGGRLEFVADAFYSAEWEQDRRAGIMNDLRRRILEKGDIDAILAFGTWAGKDSAAADLPRPVLVSSASNAVEAGIIASAADSGRDNLWAAVEENRYGRQLRIFHDIFSFSRLGLAYDPSPEGRSGISLNEIEREALALGAELVRCEDKMDISDADLAARRLAACYEQLASAEVDAVYITYNNGMAGARTKTVLAPLLRARIPTFSQAGSEEVAHGALLSIAQANMEDEGRFTAQALAGILEGKKPRELSQRYESSNSLAVNLRAAAVIGWNLPMEILAAVDEFYQDF
jgi:ABC-type uncharacterized transport system substrate-binding protein